MIDHVNAYALSVRDLEKCVSFYRDKLGFTLKDKEGDFAYLVLGKGGPGVALVSIDSAAEMISEVQIRPKENTIHRNYFAVFVEDVDKEYEDLRAKGVHFVKPPTTHPWGQRIAYFEDPEGNLWVISPLPQEIIELLLEGQKLPWSRPDSKKVLPSKDADKN
ncbi:VOC family protein [Candidatus Bathyarchaeota archaeon]|nr:MAG: VOC family protein [Candidatus Bathyarchaeota archaeon]